MRTFLGAVVVLLVACAASAQPPQPPAKPAAPGLPRGPQEPRTGTARLTGRVVSAENGRPLRRAVVRVFSAELRETRSVSTEADGRWEIKELPAGKYTINVEKGGYVPLSYGQRRPFEQGRPVEVAEGQSSEGLEISLPKGGVMTGRVVDEFGEPVAGARVAAMRLRFMNAQRRLMAVTGQGGSDTTDDVGQYRLHGLSPGDYYVSAAMTVPLSLDVSADRTGYAGTYYPGTPVAAEAQRVSVSVGQETSEINFALTPTRVAKLSGTAISSTGKPVANAMVMLMSTGVAAMGAGGSPLMGAAMTRPDGTFVLSNVPPGDYSLEMLGAADVERAAQTGVGAGIGMVITEAASLPVTVTGDDQPNITLALMPTSTATGKLVFDGAPPSETAIAGAIVFGQPSVPTSMPLGGNARVKADATFELKGLTGKRLFRINPPSGWYLKAVRVNNTDVIDTPIECKSGEDLAGVELVLTQTVATLSGAVQDAKGEATSDYVVLAFSSDSRKWGYQTRFVRRARPDQKGGFTISGLPADDYLVVALEYLEPGEEGDAELLERLRSGATRITIVDGQAKTVTLKRGRQ